MGRLNMTVWALALMPLMPFVASTAQSTPTPVIARIAATGFSTPDSSRIVEALRVGLEADSVLRIVYRPPRDSARFMAGRELEVARIVVTAEVEAVGTRRVLSLTAMDAVLATTLVRVSSDLPADRSPSIAAGESARSFTQAVARLTR